MHRTLRRLYSLAAVRKICPIPTYRQVKHPDLDLGSRRGVGDPADECERTDSFIVESIDYTRSRTAPRGNKDVLKPSREVENSYS